MPHPLCILCERVGDGGILPTRAEHGREVWRNVCQSIRQDMDASLRDKTLCRFADVPAQCDCR